MSLDGKENQSKYLDKDELAQIRFIVRSAVSKPDLIMSIRTYLSNIQKNKSTRQINRYINQYGDSKQEVDPKDKQIDWHNLSYFSELGILG